MDLGEEVRGEVGDAYPGQDEEAGVVDHEGQVAAPVFVGPADEAVAGRGLPGGGAEAEQGEGLAVGGAGVRWRPAARRGARPQVVHEPGIGPQAGQRERAEHRVEMAGQFRAGFAGGRGAPARRSVARRGGAWLGQIAAIYRLNEARLARCASVAGRAGPLASTASAARRLLLLAPAPVQALMFLARQRGGPHRGQLQRPRRDHACIPGTGHEFETGRNLFPARLRPGHGLQRKGLRRGACPINAG